jgi:hypothetical protein
MFNAIQTIRNSCGTIGNRARQFRGANFLNIRRIKKFNTIKAHGLGQVDHLFNGHGTQAPTRDTLSKQSPIIFWCATSKLRRGVARTRINRMRTTNRRRQQTSCKNLSAIHHVD